MLFDARPESIPRYAEPTWDELREDEPMEGACFNCLHRVKVTIGGSSYDLCVQERDDRKGGQTGEVYECDPDETECTDWDWDGYELRPE